MPSLKEIVTVLSKEGFLRAMPLGVSWFYRNWTNDPEFDLVEAVARTREMQLKRALSHEVG